MAKINEAERKIQEHVLKLFQDKLGYGYYGNLRKQVNSNIIAEKLRAFLLKKYSPELADRAIFELQKAAGNLQQGLYKANKNVYSLLKYGVQVTDNPGGPKTSVYFIDWENPDNNEYAIAEEVTLREKSERRPDLVVYINGIAVSVIELKKSTVSVSQGIRQNRSNESEHFNKPFFTTIQFTMAGSSAEGLRYATIETPEKYYLDWKNDTVNTDVQPLDQLSIKINEKCETLPDKLDWQIYSMFHKERFLDLIHNFIVFDKGIKKVCRHNQFFGIKKAQLKLGNGQGGIMWHTQGSGKTLTMVWLSKWILANNPEARVLIVTDRDELDEQMEKVYKGVDENVQRTRSGADLTSRLNNSQDRLICSLIHKFGNKKGRDLSEKGIEKSIEKYIEDLRASLPKDFKAKGEFVVFVDECHRTQSGLLHEAMKEILPNAILIGFTGTPLLVKDRKASIKIFSPGYIHTYKYDEAVTDGVVLDLRYEARDVDQIITQQAKIDDYFDIKTRALNEATKAKLKSKWGKMQMLYSSRDRLEVITKDIIEDFDLRPRLMDGNGNAMLVAEDIYAACRYYEIFQSRGFKQCAIITSFVPRSSNLTTEAEDAEEFKKYEVYTKMLGSQSPEDFEAEAKRKFIDEPAQMKLLIVVDKLLTGFDAPKCTFLYIDKSMQDHGLFQAICRVNRLDGESKQFGYIVDYKQLFGDLTGALHKYTSGSFEGYAAEDIGGMINDRVEEAEKQLMQTLEELEALCGGVANPREELQHLHYFCGESGVGGLDDESFARSREKLYKLTNKLVRCFAEVKGDTTTASIAELCAWVESKAGFYIALKETIGNASGDFIDLKFYEQDMRRLIDTYIRSEDSRKLGEFDDFTLLDFVQAQVENLKSENKESAAEAIENNIRKKVVEKNLINPMYYENMSAILNGLIEKRRDGAIAYEQLLEHYVELVNKSESPENNARYSENIRHSSAMRAFYDNCGEDEDFAVVLHQAVLDSKEHQFRHNQFKERRIKNAINNVLKNKGLSDKEEVERIYNIVVEQGEY